MFFMMEIFHILTPKGQVAGSNPAGVTILKSARRMSRRKAYAFSGSPGKVSIAVNPRDAPGCGEITSNTQPD